jgi:hypothetical protein
VRTIKAEVVQKGAVSSAKCWGTSGTFAAPVCNSFGINTYGLAWGNHMIISSLGSLPSRKTPQP